jgi:hypothetical protein
MYQLCTSSSRFSFAVTAIPVGPLSPTRAAGNRRDEREANMLMPLLRVIDQAGNKTDYETDYLPRIGERIMLEYGINKNLVAIHYFRVKDVMYRLQKKPDIQAAILIEEETDGEHWPS